jgi:hypothetical protein
MFFLLSMETLKLQALASWYFFAVGGAFPFALTSIILLFSAGLRAILKKTSMRVVFHFLIHILAFAIFFFVLRAVSLGVSLNIDILVPRETSDILPYFSAFVWSSIFWIRGIWIASKKPDHAFCVARFDEGLALFLAAFIIAAFIHADNPFPGRLVVPYFLFGIAAIALSRGKSDGKTISTRNSNGFSKRSGRSAIVSALAAFTLAAIGTISLMPSLFEPARRAAGALKVVGHILVDYLGIILRWLFGQKQFSLALQENDATKGPVSQYNGSDDSGMGKIFADIVMWIFIVGAALFVLALLAFILAKLFRYLSSRIEKEKNIAPGFSFPTWFKSLIVKINLLFRRIGDTIREHRRRSEAVAAFGRLVSLGRLFGVPRRKVDTPREYANRITMVFPHAAAHAGFIATSLELEIYGGKVIDAKSKRELVSLHSRIRFFAFLAEFASKIQIHNRIGEKGKHLY